ncbi:MAG: CAP domain-containing protein [Pseudomonadota bacterium]
MRRRAVLLAICLAGCGVRSEVVAPDPPDPIAEDILVGVNTLRVMEGVGRLAADPALTAAAAAHAATMAAAGELSHELGSRPAGRAAAAGYDYSRIGENIAVTTSVGLDVGRELVALWRGSPGHARNMLDGAFRETGIGVVSARGQIWAVQLFGSRR